MIDKKTENSIKSLIKILKKEKLSSIKFSNKSSSIELSQEINSQITRNNKDIINEEASTKDNVNSNQNSVQDTIDSPMVGVIYLSAKPSSPTFIKKGQKIKKGTKFTSKQILVEKKFLKKYKSKSINCPKNSALTTYSGIFHKSGNNTSNHIRFTIVVRYNNQFSKDFKFYRNLR